MRVSPLPPGLPTTLNHGLPYCGQSADHPACTKHVYVLGEESPALPSAQPHSPVKTMHTHSAETQQR